MMLEQDVHLRQIVMLVEFDDGSQAWEYLNVEGIKWAEWFMDMVYAQDAGLLKSMQIGLTNLFNVERIDDEDY